MGKQLVPDELWERLEPLFLKTESKPQGGRPRTPDRIALTGILFVLKMRIPLERRGEIDHHIRPGEQRSHPPDDDAHVGLVKAADRQRDEVGRRRAELLELP